MPRNLNYRRPIAAIRTVKMRPVVTKRTGTLGIRSKVAAKVRRKP